MSLPPVNYWHCPVCDHWNERADTHCRQCARDEQLADQAAVLEAERADSYAEKDAEYE